ncbi:MAG TPA: urate hydroxylase PuuD [Burkholderiaceae bacterium]|nr:urate hydroxylase PuuD [Burkholderiaceae bacterium]
METYLLDWANLLLRWLHVITAIAWIGSSFYFVFLDNNLIKPTSPDLLEKGVDGAIWAVHGGGFYNPQKYMVAPKKIHTHLHWFYWESYSTWLSGFALFTVLYLFNAGTYLVDKSVFDWSPAAAIATALGFLVAFWFIYDAVCRLFGFRERGELIVAGLMLVVVAVACWLSTQLFAGRAAFLLVGAMIATAMSANVFVWIIPGQRKVVAAMTSGEQVPPGSLAIHGKRGKQRSVHNTYFTLPVLFAMLSNHYSFLYTHEHNWLVLLVMMLAGALIRQFFVMRHGYKLGRNRNPAPYAVAGGALILATIVAMAPAPRPAAPTAAQGTAPAAAGYAQLQPVLVQRCLVCHGEQVQMKNIRLDTPDALKLHAQAVYQQVVVTRQMPMNNSTGITEDERQLFKRWFEGGAPVQ